MTPYWVPPVGGWFHPSSWLVPVLSLFCLIYGFFFALTAPFLIMVCVVPLVLLALTAIWALPEMRKAPVLTLEPLTFVFVIGLALWPNYLAIDLPGLPWITIIRLIGFPLMFLWLVSISVSRDYRTDLARPLAGSPLLWKLVVGFTIAQLVTMPAAGAGIGDSLQKVILQLMTWTGVFFLGCWIFMKPGRLTKYAALIWVLAIIICIIAALEFRKHQVLWAGHIPGFLKVTDANAYTALLMRTSGLYRSKGTFSSPLLMSEFLALCLPFVLQFLVRPYHWLVRIMALLSVPFIIYGITLTDSRLGLVGSILEVVVFAGIWLMEFWRSNLRSLVAGALLSMSPFMAGLFVAATFVSARLHDKVWGAADTKASNMARILEWQKGIPKIMANPFGYGAGRGGGVLDYRAWDGTLTVDSAYLTIVLDYGVIGVLLFTAVFGWGTFTCVKSSWLTATLRREDSELSFLAPVTAALGGFMLMSSVLSMQDNYPLVFLILGMAGALAYRSRLAVQTAKSTVKPAQAPQAVSNGRRLGKGAPGFWKPA